MSTRDRILSLYAFAPLNKLETFKSSHPGGKPIYFDLSGLAENEPLSADAFEIVSTEATTEQHDIGVLTVKLHHRLLPLEVILKYKAWGDTGVFTRDMTFVNRGQKPLSLASTPSLSLTLPGGEYTLRYLYGGWGEERQLAERKVEAGSFTIHSVKGRSTNGFAPWLSLRNEDTQTEYLAELAWSGNWDMSVSREPNSWPGALRERGVDVMMAVHFDFGGAYQISSGTEFVVPRIAFTVSSGDMDDAANEMHRYQRQFVFPHTQVNHPLLVQFNSWYPYQGKITIEDTKRLADQAAALGAEVFVQDAGWYNQVDWSEELGDYQADPKAFPHGLEELANYVRNNGMKFGLWVEIENAGIQSRLFHEHSGWCLSYNGKPLIFSDRCQLDFSNAEVRAWATATVDRLVQQYGLSWIKIDYNIDIGDRFDPHGDEGLGGVLYQHIIHYYRWLDEIRVKHPDLTIENCASGGLRFDTGILAHVHTNWLSDNVDPIASLALGYGCSLQFSPEVCNHWMVGDTDQGAVDVSKPEGWWSFLFRVPMNGQFGFSSRVFQWSPALQEDAHSNIALYKNVREIIAGADVYHLTPQPKLIRPTGWMALQYVNDDGKMSVVAAYRLQDDLGEQVFRLRGLDAKRSYEVTRDGHSVGYVTGADLMKIGLTIRLDEPWRASIVELRGQ
ncbi:alpha-galactosidase [Alloacidobacterium dinghuense]|uniref:alpha-galactosidase n=1 Tax=Alloacidobacterium dinghuense TaxID=2763107 RepID=A0A7G8BN57_9BACT|nr:alpha-galactosidase [Alloacidobacterium dinghuense]QNI33977.1 alpha-galactosidase [Alloacidobacterium dinghuense]